MSTLVDTVDPRHAWMLVDLDSKYSISMEIHPRMAWIYPIAEKCQRWGGVGVRGVSRMGPRHASGGLGRTPNPGLAVCAGKRTQASGCQAYRDVLAASPHSDIAPPSTDSRLLLLLRPLIEAPAGAGRSPAEPLYLTCTSITPSPTRARRASPGCT
ncbi:hypothetical protein FEO94_14720 [Stenotrophomonas maltophilia]|nr:hypothetical protein FEO94_14720 [Stenotrophomonas maltophilia]